MIRSVTPIGVEHKQFDVTEDTVLDVIRSVTPIGVEHVTAPVPPETVMP